jgi:uncharacterized tellurite resistance protein B-like protein
MLKALADLLDKTLPSKAGQDDYDPEHALNLATALLLVEVARADYTEDVSEERMIEELLRQHFDLNDEEIDLLITQARAEADYSASLQQFTRQLHEQLSVAEKHRIIEMLWRVALADQHLDKHEDHLIRRIAGLLYVSHTDLIRLRNSVYAKYK